MNAKVFFSILISVLLASIFFLDCKPEGQKPMATHEKKENHNPKNTAQKKQRSTPTPEKTPVVQNNMTGQDAHVKTKSTGHEQRPTTAGNNKSGNEVKKEKRKTKKTKPPQKKKKEVKKYHKAGKKIKNSKPKYTTIEFEELQWDFGEIYEGDVKHKTFKFKNTGEIPLQILSVKAECGCTQPTFPFLEIPPGGTGEIGVSYHSVGKEGDQNPKITVEANTRPQIIKLYISGTVLPRPKEKEDDGKIKKDSIP